MVIAAELIVIPQGDGSVTADRPIGTSHGLRWGDLLGEEMSGEMVGAATKLTVGALKEGTFATVRPIDATRELERGLIGRQPGDGQ